MSKKMGPPSKPSEAGSMGRGEARERAELSAKPEAEQSGLCLDDVSRETEKNSQDDLLESIINKSIAEQETAKEATPETPPDEKPEQEKPDEPASPTPPKRNRRSSVYLYLLVLFGAAFVLLLLAYFIQQRNSETTISDLRDTMNLSRAELMEEIDDLKREKAALEEETTRLQEEREELDAQLKELQEQWYEEASLSANQQKELVSWLSFWGLEADYLARDYEACAQFFQSIPADNVPYPLEPDSVQERVDEILQFLLRRGYLTEEEAAPFLPTEPEAEAQGQ